jgi:aerobic-type carbon monoxide dehydrogenase small subunit (CoxS/CutS family)
MPAFEIHVNGTRHRVEADPERSLLSVLRDDLDLTGAKYGCGEGQCGACTVLIGGKATRSCITKAGSVAGKPIVTIEGLEQGGRLHPLQEAFIEADAMQCGYCTPGMIVEAAALLERIRDPSERQIAEGMEGHLCRCCAYGRIVQAIRRAATRPGGKKS